MMLAGLTAIHLLFFLSLPAQQDPAATVCAALQDQSGGVVGGAAVELSAGGKRFSGKTDRSGSVCFEGLGSGSYELTIEAAGFEEEHRRLEVRAGESDRLSISLALKSMAQQVTVAEGAADAGSLNVAQTQVGTGLIQNLPSESVNAGLSSILTLATPGVAADSNGVFHPMGEHAETSFSVDGQPIADQQSRIFSNQISVSTIQEMRTIQGAPPAEFGDKTSLIVETTTRSGLNSGTPKGSVSLGYGSFATPTASISLGTGRKRSGISWPWTP
jgi:Carboxypeptidase regulatory-like domain